MADHIYCFAGYDGENDLNDLQTLRFKEELKAQDA